MNRIQEFVRCRVLMFAEGGKWGGSSVVHDKAEVQAKAIWSALPKGEQADAAKAYFDVFRGLGNRQDAEQWLKRNVA